MKRQFFFILAVSSSVTALKANSIAPDMVISTDGGRWAVFHLFDVLRGLQNTPPLAATMTAALPSQCETLPVLPISDGSLWQTLILKALEIPFVVLPQRGTVSASALDLAFALTSGAVYIAGMDLSNNDIRSHARPYGLDRFLEEKATRINPLYSQFYSRSSLLKAGGSYGIYASWFEKQLAAYPKRLYSLGKNNPLFNSLESSSPKAPGMNDFCTSMQSAGIVPAGFETVSLIYTESPSHKALYVLEKAMRDPFLLQALQAELGPILLDHSSSPSLCNHRSAPPPDELIEALRSFISRGEPNG